MQNYVIGKESSVFTSEIITASRTSFFMASNGINITYYYL